MTPRLNASGEPRRAFTEPWQLEGYAMAQALIEAGVISPSSWARHLGAALRQRADAGEPDTAGAYYAAVTEALVQLLDEANLLSKTDITDRMAAWRTAYLSTPHGQPVLLRRDGDQESGTSAVASQAPACPSLRERTHR